MRLLVPWCRMAIPAYEGIKIDFAEAESACTGITTSVSQAKAYFVKILIIDQASQTVREYTIDLMTSALTAAFSADYTS